MGVPAGIDHQVTYKFTDLLNGFRTIAELPLKEVSFSKPLNAAGAWSGQLSVEDEKVQQAGWLEATAVNRTAVWVDIDGTLVYGGRIGDRRHQLSAGTAGLSGDDFTGYFAQRLQAADYRAFEGEGYDWATTGAPALTIMRRILSDAMQSAYSIPIKITASGETPTKDKWITLSAPREQHQTIASILNQINNLGYLIGIDHALDVSYVNGVPQATCTLHYPRRGRETPTVIDLTQALDLVYDEDGSQQADKVVEIAGATTIRSSQSVWQPAREQGYPLYEAAVSHTSLAPSGDTVGVLAAYVAGYLMAYAFPLTTPVLTLPMFGSPGILDLEVGDNVQLYVPRGAGMLPANNPRFPEGLSEVFRIVRIDCKIPDQGVPTMELTLNLPPSTTPVEPPIVQGEGGGKEVVEEIKEKEESKTEEEKIKEAKEKEAEEKRVEEEIKKAEEHVKEQEEIKKEITEGPSEEKIEKKGGITKKNLKKEAEKEGFKTGSGGLAGYTIHIQVEKEEELKNGFTHFRWEEVAVGAVSVGGLFKIVSIEDKEGKAVTSIPESLIRERAVGSVGYTNGAIGGEQFAWFVTPVGGPFGLLFQVLEKGFTKIGVGFPVKLVMSRE